MSIFERVQRWARQGISTDVTTMILRSEGVSDEVIRSAYDELILSGHAEITVERGVSTLRMI